MHNKFDQDLVDDESIIQLKISDSSKRSSQKEVSFRIDVVDTRRTSRRIPTGIHTRISIEEHDDEELDKFDEEIKQFSRTSNRPKTKLIKDPILECLVTDGIIDTHSQKQIQWKEELEEKQKIPSSQKKSATKFIANSKQIEYSEEEEQYHFQDQKEIQRKDSEEKQCHYPSQKEVQWKQNVEEQKIQRTQKKPPTKFIFKSKSVDLELIEVVATKQNSQSQKEVRFNHETIDSHERTKKRPRTQFLKDTCQPIKVTTTPSICAIDEPKFTNNQRRKVSLNFFQSSKTLMNTHLLQFYQIQQNGGSRNRINTTEDKVNKVQLLNPKPNPNLKIAAKRKSSRMYNMKEILKKYFKLNMISLKVIITQKIVDYPISTIER